MAMDSIYWLVVVGGCVAWVMAYGIGANDVANAFATSVGSHTLKLKWAICIAAVMETLGAIFLGGSVSSTISGGVANPDSFASTPDVFAYGMLCALSAAAMWLLVATYLELPVSTTHSIVGGVMGFALVYGGADAVIWNKRIPDFPFISGVSVIVASWFVSPVLAGLISFSLFGLLKLAVLRRPNSPIFAIWCLPVLLLITLFVNMFFILSKGAKNVVSIPVQWQLIYSAIAGAGAAIIGGGIGMPLLFRAKKSWDATLADYEAQGKEISSTGVPKSNASATGLPGFLKTIEVDPNDKSLGAFFSRVRNALTGGINADVFECIDDDADLKSIHDQAERFDPRTEQVFKYLQVISAAAVSFAHGANDVANAVGPFAAIYNIYEVGYISKKSSVEPWMLGGIGATGIVIGLATYGWKIMRVLGVKLTSITPCRGFTMETTTALVTAFGSYLGIPLSTTQTHVGSTTGVGLSEGRKGSVKWLTLLKMFGGWVFTLLVGVAVSGALFAQGVYTPNLPQARIIAGYQQGVVEASQAQLAYLAPTVPEAATGLEALNKTTHPSKGIFPSSSVNNAAVLGFLNSSTELMFDHTTVG